jgi:hypothetical protein
MLDRVERRGFLIEPARKDPPPAVVRLAHVELDERAGQRFFFPRRARLAGAQAHDGILDPDRLARPKRQVADDAVALVEQADDGDPLGHRGNPFLPGDGRPRHIDGDRLAFLRLVRFAATGKQCQRHQADRGAAHDYSGIQGW